MSDRTKLNAKKRSAQVATPMRATTEQRPSAVEKRTIALVYDFDGTLSPKPMQEYTVLPKLNADPQAFWAESNRLAREHGADPLITYMHLMYKKAKEKGLVVDRAALVKQGASVELYPGVTEWFGAIGDYPVSSCATTSFRRD